MSAQCRLWPGRVPACSCTLRPFVVPGLHLVSSRKVRGTSVCLVPGSPESWSGRRRLRRCEDLRPGRGVGGRRALLGASLSAVCAAASQRGLAWPVAAALPPAALLARLLPRCPWPHSHPPVFLPVGFIVGSRVDPAGTAGRQQPADLREATGPCRGERNRVPTRLRCAPVGQPCWQPVCAPGPGR